MIKNFLLTISFIILSVGYAQIASDSDILLVGVLQKNAPKTFKNPSEYVLEDGYIYQAAQYNVGGISLQHDQVGNLDPLLGNVVVAKGKLIHDLNKILKKGEKAPEDYGQEESMMQIRSDWVGPETGFSIGRSSKEKLEKLSFVQCQSIEKYQGFTVKKEHGTITVQFQNLLGVVVENINISAHYESYKGKPSPAYLDQTCSHFMQQATLVHEYANSINYDKKSYRLEEICISAEQNGIIIAVRKNIK